MLNQYNNLINKDINNANEVNINIIFPLREKQMIYLVKMKK